MTANAVEHPEAVYDALESQRGKIETQIKPWVEKYGAEPLKLEDAAGTPISVKQRLVEALTPDEGVTAGFIQDGLKAVEKYNTTDPSVA